MNISTAVLEGAPAPGRPRWSGMRSAAPSPPRIAAPTTLIWGRHDLATPLRMAEAASARHGWPLHVIENAADDPAMEQPQAFLAALRPALETLTGTGAPR